MNFELIHFSDKLLHKLISNDEFEVNYESLDSYIVIIRSVESFDTIYNVLPNAMVWPRVR